MYPFACDSDYKYCRMYKWVVLVGDIKWMVPLLFKYGCLPLSLCLLVGRVFPGSFGFLPPFF